MYFLYLVKPVCKGKKVPSYLNQWEFHDSLHQGQDFTHSLNFSQIPASRFTNNSDVQK